MAKTKAARKDNIPTKKLKRQMIEQRLEEALADLKSVVGKKKFEQNIRKAGKVINNSFSRKTFEKLRKAKENSLNNGKDALLDSHASIHDLP